MPQQYCTAYIASVNGNMQHIATNSKNLYGIEKQPVNIDLLWKLYY